MNFFGLAFRDKSADDDSHETKALTGTTQVVEALANRTGNLMIPLGGTNVQAINAAFMRGQSAAYGWLYKHRPAVRMVVDYIASNAAQLPLELYERLDDLNRKRVEDHPAATTMDYPTGEYRSDATPPKQFIEGLIKDYLIFDRACVLKFRTDAGPLVLQRVPPTMVLPFGGRFVTDFYRVFRVDGSFFDVPPDDVIHWHGYNPDDALVGWSKLETLRDSLTEDAVSQTTTVELLKNGLKGGHIERSMDAPEWTPEQRQRFQETWSAQRVGSPRLDPVLEDSMKWVPTAITPKDAELLAGRQWTVDEVSATYGFPADLLRRAAGEAGELIEARKQFYSDTLPTLMEPLAERFDQDICVAEFDRPDFYYEFDLNEKLRGDPVQRFAAITSAVGRPWRTVNEARALDNLPPIDGGDELSIPLNVALGSLPAPNVMPPQDPNGPPQDGSHRDPGSAPAAPAAPDPAKALAARAMELVTGQLGGKVALKAESDPVPQLIAKRKADLARQQRYVDEAAAVMDGFYARQERAIKRKAREVERSSNGNGHRTKAEFDNARWDSELSADLNTLLSSIVEREGGIYVARLMGDDFDMRMVTNYLKATSSGIASAINDVTESDIEDVGTDEAFSRARNVRAAVAGSALGAKATIFARTEAAKQSPDPQLRTKTWVADTQRHEEFDGDTVGINEDWPAGFAPGSAPNCGCTATIN